MLEERDLAYFRKSLIKWFEVNKRDFPWREEGVSNYELILSEVLLQRTKAETVGRYYRTFFNRYPNWDSLASSTIEDLEELLRPLGLYRHRARRIYKIAAGYIEKNGKLPRNINELRESSLSSLYIAGAYEIFVLKKRAALLDVNMARVVARVFNHGQIKDIRSDKQLQELAREVTNIKLCKELNWAILDFAAMVCKSSKPSCNDCPLQKRCSFNRENKVEVNEVIEKPRTNRKRSISQ
jgi:A/G-specific adenine glycosylase